MWTQHLPREQGHWLTHGKRGSPWWELGSDGHQQSPGAPQRWGEWCLVGQAWAQVQLCTGAAHFRPLRVSYPVHREGLTTPRCTSCLPRVMNPRLQGNDNVHENPSSDTTY